MMVYILFILWAASICVISDALSDAQLHPIETQDLKSIVDSVKRDVDHHLKMTSNRMESSLPNTPEYDKSAVVDIDKFMKMIQDSMQHHLVRNLGQPSDAKNGGSPMTENKLSEASISDQPSEQPSEDSSEFSFQVHEIRVGSTKGMPGVHFPDYTDIPRTSFICSDKANLPGFYADLDTGCQVFHVCWPDRKESFLCPLGTIFNQALQVCDYWYNFNCSLAPYYYTANAELEPRSSKDKNESVSSMIETLLEKTDSSSAPKVSSTGGQPAASSVISFVSQFMPIKAKIVVYPETADRRSKIVTSASIGGNKGHIKSRSRQKNRGSPKHSRVRRSAHEYQDAHEYQELIDYAKSVLFPFEEMNESYSEVLQFRMAEALDVALMDIRKNTTYSMVAGHVEKVVNFIKKYFLKPDLPEYLDLEPGSDLYEYDRGLQEKFEHYQVVTNGIVWIIAAAKYRWDNTGSKEEVAPEFEEYEDFEPAPLTHLNPRFIVEPATEETFGLQKDSSKHLKSRVERAATVLHPLKLKHKGCVNIYPGTKKALLKNYVKLFKTKRA